MQSRLPHMQEVRLGLGASRLAHTTDTRTIDTRVVHCLGVWSSFCMSRSRNPGHAQDAYICCNTEALLHFSPVRRHQC